MTVRSNRAEVRNPVLALPASKRLQGMPPDVRAAVADLFHDISCDARRRAQESWRKNKGPMAVYWKAVGAYAAHIRNALRRGGETEQRAA